MLMLGIAFVAGMVFHHFVGHKLEDKMKGMLDGIKGLF
jgi:hypothetical protein